MTKLKPFAPALSKLFALALALLLVALAHAVAVAAQPTQGSLVRAWEDVQRDDPETVTFEKTGEGRYRFKTNRFPFDGELRVLKATVSDWASSDEEEDGLAPGTSYGVIEYDLVGLPEEVSRKYAHSLQAWERNNRLYFDGESGSWLTPEKYGAKTAAKYREQAEARRRDEQSKKQTNFWVNIFMWWGPMLALIAFWAWIIKRTGIRRQREYMNMAAAHMQRNEELLERIADALEKGGAAPYARGHERQPGAQPPA